jgi:S1-C subfamily serine protease
MAREPFYQELSYDLTMAKTITFQDIVIEVDSANQQFLDFRVLKGPAALEQFQPAQLVGFVIEEDGTIRSVDRGTAAERAGLVAGDKILRINGSPLPVGNLAAIKFMLTSEPNRSLYATFLRSGKEMSANIVRLGTEPTTTQDTVAGSKDSILGMEINFRGVVSSVLKNSIADRLGFRRGDSIESVNGVDVHRDGDKARQLLLASASGTVRVVVERFGANQTISWER